MYVPVRTALYSKQYVPVRTFGKFSQDGTYQYIQVRTGIDTLPKVRTSTYEYVLLYVYHGIWQYMEVQGSACKSLSWYMAVYDGTWKYIFSLITVYDST